MHYHFVEIGTSDFDTCLQAAGKTTVGLSVEPVKTYLDRLPDKPHITKINCAVSDTDGTLDVFYVPPEKISDLGLPDWVRGCNSVGTYHPTVRTLIAARKLDPEDVFTRDTIPVKSFATLVADHKITSIGTLKVDTEGHDCIILHSYLAALLQTPSIMADKIIFESNELLTTRDDIEHLMTQLKAQGYHMIGRDTDNTYVTRSYVWLHRAHFWSLQTFRWCFQQTRRVLGRIKRLFV